MESHCGQLASRRICENAFQGFCQKPRPQSCLQESTRSTVVLGTVVLSTVQSFLTMMGQ